MKRIWFPQQKPFDYLPLRAGLGYITEDDLTASIYPGMSRFTMLCPKIYTTRTRPMSGEYYVVEGSRFKAKPVEPRIEFKVRKVAEIDMDGVLTQRQGQEFNFVWRTFPEQDLGIKGATFDQLKSELMRLYPKTTMDTPFYVNLLEKV